MYTPEDISDDKDYRKQPFIITAALGGDVDTFSTLGKEGGCSVNESGFIGFS